MMVAYFSLTLALMLEQVLCHHRLTQAKKSQVSCNGVEM